MSKFYLVTGGAGFLGAALVRALAQQGHRVRVLDNLSRGSAERLADMSGDIEFIAGDIRNSEIVSQAVSGVDSVCHLAFVNGTKFFYTMPEVVLEVGIKGMINVLDACLAHDVKEFILASSSEVYQTPPTIPTDETTPLSVPDPLNPRYSYSGGKIISELMAINYGRKFFERVVIFRPHNVYGPQMGWEHVIPQFIVRMKELVEEYRIGIIPFPIQGTGEETRAFVYIDDFTDGLLRIVNHGEHITIYHIGTQDETTIANVALLVAQSFGREIKIIPGALAEGGTRRRCPDIARLRSLGYQPKVSLEQGIRLTKEWYVANKPLSPG